MNRSSLFAIVAVCTLVSAVACDKKDSPAPTADTSATKATTPGSTAAGPGSAVAAKVDAPAAGAIRLDVKKAKATFLIDAPAEKIKGASEDGKGQLDVVPADLTKTRGEIDLRLTSLKTSTFGDAEKDSSQTEHAQNWMEVGPESSAEKKKQFEWTKFTITQVETATPKLADVKEDGGVRTVKAKVTGDYWLHGVSASKTVMVTATITGPADAPTAITLKTDTPFAVSMKEHQVMPRDKVGSFLAGALEKIGQKIDDKVQVSIEATAQK